MGFFCAAFYSELWVCELHRVNCFSHHQWHFHPLVYRVDLSGVVDVVVFGDVGD